DGERPPCQSNLLGTAGPDSTDVRQSCTFSLLYAVLPWSSPPPGHPTREGAIHTVSYDAVPESGAGHDPALLEMGEHLPGALFDRLGVGAEGELGLEGRLVGRRDAGELGDLRRARLLVEPLHVALLAHLERAVDQHLDEVAGLHDGAHLVAVGAVGRDEGGQC